MTYLKNNISNEKINEKIKIISYNIHGWDTMDGENNYQNLLIFLKNQNADFIALQEVILYENDVNVLKKLAKDLGMNCVYGEQNQYFHFGLALLSKTEIKEYTNLDISKKKNQRTLLSVYFDDFDIHIVHLDHLDENLRKYEIDRINEITNKNKCHFLIGDFNSLTKDDYDDTKWKKIFSERKKFNIEKPQTIVMSQINESYIDVLSKYGTVVPTCCHDVRVDYVFVDKNFEKSFKIVSCDVIKEENTSDHYPISFIFSSIKLKLE
jgi:endonuclease/exonuclease/phosphatase family metal-dependent hydrolase